MRKRKRGNVWIAVAGFVVEDEKVLVVKKRYSGLKGKWSLPAGFVDEGETMDEAALREVKEETGIECEITGLSGIRTGVIQDTISDNMVIFSMKAVGGQLQPQLTELFEAAFLSPEQLLQDRASSNMLKLFLREQHTYPLAERTDIHPGDQFGYTNYKIFK
ncbi:NUDIX domain-containing protein [Bacillus tianshenii]|nr:NUDIX domain-containing protein [Bacillus tianshenii]